MYIKLCKTNFALQIIFHLATRMERERSNTLGSHMLPWQLKLHTFDYTVITYEQFSSQSWNKQHYTQDDNGHCNNVQVCKRYKAIREMFHKNTKVIMIFESLQTNACSLQKHQNTKLTQIKVSGFLIRTFVQHQTGS